ncbi:unnamed protein product [Cuscuta epithymum]|uniref:YqgF/RNase H-like domain-containing protein n=2 Tax=Cuscuta epithymum TaxID=186058 RepID=A0AAV0DP32_9ASTE|nr:unnamed protein product [Cuscuta epithymum]
MGTVKLGGLSLPFPIQLPYLVPGKCNTYLNCIRSTTQSTPVKSALSVDEIPPNAMRQASEPRWSSAGFSLGVDLGLSRTGLAISKGFAFRPLMVLELRGQKLEDRLVHIAQKQEVDEFIVGLPLSSDGKETPQSNKVRSIAGASTDQLVKGSLMHMQLWYIFSSVLNLPCKFCWMVCCSRDISQWQVMEWNLLYPNNLNSRSSSGKPPL